jgi:hypothetical protein
VVGPAAVVLGVAHRLRAHAVYVASHGRKGAQRFSGSVAEPIARWASCPLVVARPHDRGGLRAAAERHGQRAASASAAAGWAPMNYRADDWR